MNKVINFTEVIYDYDSNYNVVDTKSNLYKNPDISFSPSWIVGGTVTAIPVTGLEIAFVTKFVSKQYLDNTQSENRKLKGYAVNNLRVSYALKKIIWMKEIDFTLMINNLFNVKYVSNGYTYGNLMETASGIVREDYNYYYPQAGINVMGGIMLKF